MLTLARRLFWLAVLSGAGYAVYTAWQRRNEPMPDGPAAWPPLDDEPAAGPASLPDLGEVADSSVRAPLPDLGGSTDGSSGRAPLPDLDDDPHQLDVATSGQKWVEPDDGQCPIGHPIKGNANSGIYHVPGGRFYDRTVPDRCYATEDDAVVDGYRRAKA